MSSYSQRTCSLHRFVVMQFVVGTFASLMGCGGPYGPSEYERYKKKQEGFAGIIGEAGGTAVKEGKSMHGFQMTGWMIDLADAKVTDQLIAQIVAAGEHDPVFELNFSNTEITDDQLADLDAGKVLQKTVILNLSNTRVSDAGLDQLSNYYCLTKLNLKGSKATAEGARRLGAKMIANPTTPPPFRKQPEVTI